MIRRRILTGLVAAPFVARLGLLMPVRSFQLTPPREWHRIKNGIMWKSFPGEGVDHPIPQDVQRVFVAGYENIHDAGDALIRGYIRGASDGRSHDWRVFSTDFARSSLHGYHRFPNHEEIET